MGGRHGESNSQGHVLAPGDLQPGPRGEARPGAGTAGREVAEASSPSQSWSVRRLHPFSSGSLRGLLRSIPAHGEGGTRGAVCVHTCAHTCVRYGVSPSVGHRDAPGGPRVTQSGRLLATQPQVSHLRSRLGSALGAWAPPSLPCPPTPPAMARPLSLAGCDLFPTGPRCLSAGVTSQLGSPVRGGWELDLLQTLV